MEIQIRLDLPESFSEPLGIDDDTIVESYIDNGKLHINIYAGDAEDAILPDCSRQPCNEDCACCEYE